MPERSDRRQKRSITVNRRATAPSFVYACACAVNADCGGTAKRITNAQLASLGVRRGGGRNDRGFGAVRAFDEANSNCPLGEAIA
jgi:hypothetical protein